MSDNVFDVGGFKVRIEQDQDPESPRDWDNLGTMVCWHRRYHLGDKHSFATPQDFTESEEYRDAAIVLPLAMLDHSGLHMWVGSGPHWSDSHGWDSGQVGYVYVTRARLLQEYSRKRLTKATLAKATEVLQAEVKTYDQFLTGDVYGYVVEDDAGNHVDSCWGFFGFDYCKSEAMAAAESALDKEIETLDAH